MTSSATGSDFEDLLHHLKETRGFDFTAYKRTTLRRRVLKRMGAVSAETYDEYGDYLDAHPDEYAFLFNTILINVTSFFRDQPAWDFLRREIIPRILAGKKQDAPIRVWCAGCASGEEAYSVGMVLAEAVGPEAFRQRVKIYATEVDEDALNTARQGIYSERAMNPVPPDLREKYFERISDRYAFKRDYRRSIIFGRHDLIQDAPISRIDLLVSRNTMMYFNPDAQAKVIARFFYALNEGGYIFLGKAETLLAHTHAFAPVDLKFRLFAKPSSDGGPRSAVLISAILPEHREKSVQDREQIQQLAFQEDPVAQIVIDLNLALILANGTARELFGIGGGDIGRPLQDLEVSYKPLELRSLIARVVADKQPILQPEVVNVTRRGRRWFDVHFQPLLAADGSMLAVKISFLDVTRPWELAEELQQSRNDLEAAYEQLRSSNEELETTNEELQSSNEELETTNEELQSTNEELETMNEELQSTNEELETVNEELRERGIEMSTTKSFLESVLTSLRVGVAVVDYDLVIRAWNMRAEDLWGVRADEVSNTHFMNLDIGLKVEALVMPLRDCLSGRSDFDEIFEATNRRGRPILCRVSLSPLRETDQQITGSVILMEEVSSQGAVEN